VASDPTPTAADPTPTASDPSPEPTAPESASPAPTTTGPPASQPPDAPADFGVFWEAFRVVQDRYVDRAALEPPSLTHGAIRGMVDALNDTGHSLFLTPEDLAAEQQSLQGVIIGIGVVLDATSAVPTFTTVISGGPADRAGIRPGDQLLKVDDRDVVGLASSEIVRFVRGPEGSTVRLTVVHKGQTEPVEVSIVRERITVPAVTSAMVPGTDILHLRVVQFSNGAAEQFHQQLRQGIDDGARRVVLDLRNDPGGFVNEAIAIASEFLQEGNVYLRQDAQGERTPQPVVAGGLAHDLPVVVLIDKGTASSAEIVAGALQDAERGPVIGVTTFGTGTLLNVFELSDGSAVRLGIEQWLTPDGREIWRKGIAPDEAVELPADGLPLEPDDLDGQTVQQLLGGKDTQFARALQLLGAS
jgi:carboxyl-terminal processing protease